MILSADRLIPVFGWTQVSVERVEGPTTTTTRSSGFSSSILLGEKLGVGSIHTIPRVGFDVQASCGMFTSI